MNNFEVHPLASSWIVLLFLLPLGYFLWRESERKLRFRFFRLLSLVLLFLSLLGFYFRPGFLHQKSSTAVVVLTPGYTTTAVDSLLQSEKELSVVNLKGVPGYRGSIELNDQDLERYASSVRWVLGEGFSLAELDRLKNLHFRFLPTSATEGIQSLEIPKEITVGNEGVLSGTIASSKSQWLRLSGPGGVEDSIFISPGVSSFHLSFTPKKPGPQLYSLQSGDRVAEPVPVVVKKEEKLRILFLQKYPTAESRALKNFLEEKGHSLVLRQQISRENFFFSYANTAPTPFTSITEKLLQNFDLLVIDEVSLGGFSKPNQVVILQAIEDGLGVHVLPWEENKNVNWLFPAAPEKTDRDTLHVKLKKSYVLNRSRHQWQEKDGIIPVWKVKEMLLSGYFLVGRGKVSTQVITETFPIRFQGDEKEYAQIWSQLISRVARTKSQERLTIRQRFPYYPGDPLEIHLISNRTKPIVSSDNNRISLHEETFVDDSWSGKTWAVDEGWHRLATEEDTLHYWVNQQDQWESLRLINQLHENNLKQAANALTASSPQHFQEIPLLLFFLFFIVAAGFLWLAPKL